MINNHHVPSLDRLIHELKKWPGIGPRSADRLALWLLKAPLSQIHNLTQALTDIKKNINRCSNCLTLTEQQTLCYLCASPSRNKELICVVEEPSNLTQIETAGKFNGQYHVLHGVLSPLNNVNPDNLTITALITKIKTNNIKEVILAFDANMEGDITALYISKIIKPYNIKISRLAHGIPVGGDINYMDKQTLGQAYENRVEL